MHDLHWTEATIAEDACDEFWRRLARAITHEQLRMVTHSDAQARRNGRDRSGIGEHVVAKRVRDAP